ncbi:hypothetical protein GQ600_24629 [Phytophthora cactorum]|nr:hypothetical protein GQ600_24629 [Phytophthora cactorum]
MGGNLSVVCGLAASDSDRDLQLLRPTDEQSWALIVGRHGLFSGLHFVQLGAAIPDAYMPKDIQVLSQRRQRNGHHHHMASRSSFGFSGKNSSRCARRSQQRSGRDPGKREKKYNFGIKTASSSFGYSDDETPNTAAPIRGADSSRLSMQELRVK